MKNFSSLILLLSISFCFNSVHASDFYLSARALAGFSKTDDISASGLLSNTLTKNNSKDEVGGFGAAFGLNRGIFNYELEYFWRYRIDRGYEFGSRPNPSLTGTQSFFSANTGSHSIMAHVHWNFLNQSSFIPFISVGLGGILHDSDMNLTVPLTPTSLTTLSENETDIDLTWSLGAGYSI